VFARLQRHVGFSHFYIIGWDLPLELAASREQIASILKAEIEFIEQLLFIQANSPGFYSDNVIGSGFY
jgi:hypothetical protein